jgi:hypothetical protein
VRTGVFPGHPRASGAKGCVLSNLVPSGTGKPGDSMRLSGNSRTVKVLRRLGLVRRLGRSACTVRRSSPAKHTLVGNCSLGRPRPACPRAWPGHRQLVDKGSQGGRRRGSCRGCRQQRQTYWVLRPWPIVFDPRTCPRAHPAWPMSYRLVTGNGSGGRSPRSGARRSPAAACWPASHRPPAPARSPRCKRQIRAGRPPRPHLATRGSDDQRR